MRTQTGNFRRRYLLLLNLVPMLLVSPPLGSTVHADVFGYEFRPGPHVPKEFKPGPGVDASGLDLSGSTFVGMDLSGADFDGCDLRRTAFFQVVNRRGPASFRGADVRNAAFSESDMHPASDFTDALINGSTWGHDSRFLTTQQIRSTKSYQINDLSECCIGGESASLNEGETYPKVALDLRGFNLRGALFIRGDFTDCEFAGADMREVKFHAAVVTQAQLTSADNGLRYRFSPRDGSVPFDWKPNPRYQGLVFDHVDLSGWDFSHCSLRGTIFQDTCLNGARFNDSDVRNASFIRSMSPGQLRSTKSFREGNLTGMRIVHLARDGLRFDHFDFSGQTLANCVLDIDATGAVFTDAVITGANLQRCRGLTAEQVKSTVNHRFGRMEGIELPQEIPGL